MKTKEERVEDIVAYLIKHFKIKDKARFISDPWYNPHTEIIKLIRKL